MQQVLNSAGDPVILTRGEYDALEDRIAALERFVKDFLVKRRELAIIEMGDIEQRLGMPRTKEKRSK